MCAGRTSTEILVEDFPYTTPKGEVTLSARVPYEICETCGFRMFGAAGERARTEAVYRYLGRLTPWQIVSIRQSLNLNQSDFAEKLGVGHASLERWERGVNIQNQSSDNLLLLMSKPGNSEWLATERNQRAKQDIQNDSVVDLEKFRALSHYDTDLLTSRRAQFRLRRLVISVCH